MSHTSKAGYTPIHHASRLIPLLTLIPAIFTLISIILINIGGIPIHKINHSPTQVERNTAFPLLSWNFSSSVNPISPDVRSQVFTVYLNRICTAEIAESSFGSWYYPVGPRCRDDGPLGMVQQSDLPVRGSFLQSLRLFYFRPLNMNLPFGFYIVAAVGSFLMLFISVGGVLSTKRVVHVVGVFVAWLSWFFVLMASSYVTAYMRRLRHNIETYTVYDRSTGGRADGLGLFLTEISLNSIKLGHTVLGLTWSSVAAMWIAGTAWTWLAFDLPRREKKQRMLDEKAVYRMNPAVGDDGLGHDEFR